MKLFFFSQIFAGPPLRWKGQNKCSDSHSAEKLKENSIFGHIVWFPHWASFFGAWHRNQFEARVYDFSAFVLGGFQVLFVKYDGRRWAKHLKKLSVFSCDSYEILTAIQVNNQRDIFTFSRDFSVATYTQSALSFQVTDEPICVFCACGIPHSLLLLLLRPRYFLLESFLCGIQSNIDKQQQNLLTIKTHENSYFYFQQSRRYYS